MLDKIIEIYLGKVGGVGIMAGRARVGQLLSTGSSGRLGHADMEAYHRHEG